MPITAQQSTEIDALRHETTPTCRDVAPGVEELLYKAIPILDHGFIRVIHYMGTDAAIVQAARVSYGKGTRKVNEDAGLINYLMRHRHTTPFEMCEIKFHIKLPIFIARQWIRHRTANVNEYSGRYSIMDKGILYTGTGTACHAIAVQPAGTGRCYLKAPKQRVCWKSSRSHFV